MCGQSLAKLPFVCRDQVGDGLSEQLTMYGVPVSVVVGQLASE